MIARASAELELLGARFVAQSGSARFTSNCSNRSRANRRYGGVKLRPDSHCAIVPTDTPRARASLSCVRSIADRHSFTSSALIGTGSGSGIPARYTSYIRRSISMVGTALTACPLGFRRRPT